MYNNPGEEETIFVQDIIIMIRDIKIWEIRIRENHINDLTTNPKKNVLNVESKVIEQMNVILPNIWQTSIWHPKMV